jgi:hypothetical protein
MKRLSAILLTTVAAFAVSGAAEASDKTSVKSQTTMEQGKNGGYDKTSSSVEVTPAGKTSAATETKLKVEDDGDSEKTTTIKHTKDPRGLMNKHTDKLTVKEKVTEDGSSVERTRKIDGKTVLDSSSEVTKK